jgi:hypothetical protein
VQVVELKIFADLTVEETADVLNVSPVRLPATGAWREPGY